MYLYIVMIFRDEIHSMEKRGDSINVVMPLLLKHFNSLL